MVLRAGTLVMGMPAPISPSLRPLGTSMSSVSAEPPMPRRSMSMTRKESAPSARPSAWAAGSSTACRCPYRKLSAWQRRPAALASASAGAEASPPESKTMASGAAPGPVGKAAFAFIGSRSIDRVPGRRRAGIVGRGARRPTLEGREVRVRQGSTWPLVLWVFAGCSGAHLTANTSSGGTRFDGAPLLACLGAPPDAIYDPGRLATPPEPGLSVHTFDQVVLGCGAVERRYLSYVPPRLGAPSAAPVLIVLHGQGASAEAMMSIQTRGTFNRLADDEGLLIIYGYGLPTAYNFAGLANSGRR